MSTLVRDVDQTDFADVVVEGSRTRPVVVDFWAAWCGPCTQLSPALEQAALNFQGEVDVVKVDVDANPGLAQQFGVQGIPAVKAFADGVMVSEFTGLQPPAVIDQFFAALAPSDADRLVAQASSAPAAEAEALYTRAIEAEVDHPGAGVGLATLMMDTGRNDEAREVLARARPTAEVQRLSARLSLGEDTGDIADLQTRLEAGEDEVRVTLGRALAAAGRHQEAIEVLLAGVAVSSTREAARDALLEVFTVLGNDDPLVRGARPRLAAALF